MSQNVHISSLTAPESLGPKDFQHFRNVIKLFWCLQNLQGMQKRITRNVPRKAWQISTCCHKSHFEWKWSVIVYSIINSHIATSILTYTHNCNWKFYNTYVLTIPHCTPTTSRGLCNLCLLVTSAQARCPKFFVSFQYLAQKWVYEKQVHSVNVTDVPNCLHFSFKKCRRIS